MTIPQWQLAQSGYYYDPNRPPYSNIWDISGRTAFDNAYRSRQEATSMNFGLMAKGYQDMADKALQDSLDGAKGLTTQYEKDYGDISAMIASLSPYQSSLMDFSGKVSGLADSLAPYASTLSGYGSDLWGQGRELYDAGAGLMGRGQSILDMNASGDSLEGRYISALKAIDPNRYVSMAGADVQASFANALAQMQRNLERQGADGSSGRSQSMSLKAAQALAAAKSGAMTRARQQGINDQAAAMQGALGVASGMMSQGAGIAGQGAQVQTAGGQMYQAAAGIIGQQGQLMGAAGQLVGQAGGLASQQAQLGMQHSANMTGFQLQQQQTLAQAQMNAVNYYAQIAGGYGQLASKEGLAYAFGF